MYQHQQQAHGRPLAVPRAQQGGAHPRQPRTFHSTHIVKVKQDQLCLLSQQQPKVLCICKTIIAQCHWKRCEVPFEFNPLQLNYIAGLHYIGFLQHRPSDFALPSARGA